MRQLEDYRYLHEPENRLGLWWERLKYSPLGSSREPPFLTLGSEVRVRYELIDNTDFGSGPQDNGGYLLTRYMPYASLTMPDLPGGAELQLFGQVEAAFSNYDERGPGPIDEDAFDFLQAFAKITLPMGAGKLFLQGGRQHISFGSERLLGTRYGPNIPLSFDGGLLHWKAPPWDLHAFYLRPVQVDPDPLNNLSDSDQQLWGVYATRRLEDLLPGLSKAALDFYYLGFFDSAATYNTGTGRELRHTLGSRFFGSQNVLGGVLDWNYEAMFQFGSFDSERGEASILAWSVGTETAYTLDAIFTPRFSLRANIVSGDQNPADASLQTFSPLFPKGKYFGELTPVGPYNLINLLGAAEFTLSDKIVVSIQGGPYWRFSANDAVYGVGGNIVRGSDTGPGDSSNARFIGMQLEFVAEWRPSRNLAFLASYSQFQPGEFIAETGPSETIHFFAVEAIFQF